jgi:hypothetical protein
MASPIVIDYINGLIERHYPRASTPHFVNYDIFKKELFSSIYDNICDQLDNKSDVLYDNDLLVGWPSTVFLDELYYRETYEIKIPQSVRNAYINQK